MELGRIKVSGVRATPCGMEAIPAGIVGGTVRLEYTDPVWDNLKKTVVFQSYVAIHSKPAATVTVLNPEEVVRIPAEVTARAGYLVSVGVFGTDEEDNLIIPTIWGELGRVQEATDPSGEESTDPALPVWAQLQEQIDDLKENGTGGGLVIESDGAGNVTIG